MKFRPVIVNPARRNEVFHSVVRALGINDADVQADLRRRMTPPALRHLSDHAGRGQKSLGRIQQINNRRRFKTRKAVSR